MNNRGFREYFRMRLRPEARRYMNAIVAELENRGIVGDYLWWVLEAYERTCFLYELKHNSDTYNMPVEYIMAIIKNEIISRVFNFI